MKFDCLVIVGNKVDPWDKMCVEGGINERLRGAKASAALLIGLLYFMSVALIRACAGLCKKSKNIFHFFGNGAIFM